jgi:HJR/Mrr/RecB family endonuclease
VLLRKTLFLIVFFLAFIAVCSGVAAILFFAERRFTESLVMAGVASLAFIGFYTLRWRRRVFIKKPVFHAKMTPQDFEKYCADVLRFYGWDARLTPASGDHGADVIAVRDTLCMVFQVKLYKNPVGNKAVQEAYAAQAHYKANAACVVTNATFTPQARLLSRSTHVWLCHYTELPHLFSRVQKALQQVP